MLRREHNITSLNLYVCMSVCVHNYGNQGFITETHPLLYYIVVTVCTVFSMSKVLYMLGYSYTTVTRDLSQKNTPLPQVVPSGSGGFPW